MNKEINNKLAIPLLIIIAAIIGGWIISECNRFSISLFPRIIPSPILPSPLKVKDIEKFSSEEDFKSYLQEAELAYASAFGMIGVARGISVFEEAMPAPMVAIEKEEVPERISETTVQVLGVDEPDIVKTDGKEIYFSLGESYYWTRFWEIMPPKIIGETKVVKAFPPTELSVETKIDKRGDLLLYNNILVIFSGNTIYGYDVSNPENPEKKWEMELENNNYVLSARLYKDKIYLIIKTSIDTYHPCPIKPLSVEGDSLTIECTEIYHPVTNIPVDVTYTAIVFDPSSGKVEKNVSFVGSSSQSILYMSENGIYITYFYPGDFIKFFSDFLTEKCQDIIPNWVIEKMEKLTEYDISDSAKLVEFEIIMQKYISSLDEDEELRIQNEFTNRMTDYYKDHKRDLEKTGIVKIGLDNFNILTTGNVPGKPLNQFSLDEYENYLRIATTIGESFWGMGPIGGVGESGNDIYVLDKDLKITGSIKDLGLTERIYSVRFIEDKGYLVTFRQIDPFFVIDLSDPQKPELKGQLKIPGYSSYLHPITKDKILGIGMEDWKVKISLFDVTSPENPTEIAKYILDEYWSDILNTHHAFLLDKKHEIFFLPGSKGGYVFSYKDYQLKLTKAVSDIMARRALYINDYLYIIGDDKIIVLNEINWEKVNKIEF